MKPSKMPPFFLTLISLFFLRLQNYIHCNVCSLSFLEHLTSTIATREAHLHDEEKDAELARIAKTQKRTSLRKPFPPVFLTAQARDDALRIANGKETFHRFFTTAFINAKLGVYASPVDFIHALAKGVVLDILNLLYSFLMSSAHKPGSLSLVNHMSEHCEHYRKMMAMQVCS